MFNPKIQAGTGCITVAWDQSSDANIVAYNLYYSEASSVVTNKVQVGNVNSVNICGVETGKTYNILASAVNSDGRESVPSPVLGYTCPEFVVSAPSISAGKASFAPGEAIAVNFGGASGNARDWIGLYPAGAVNASYLQWIYTDGSTTGTAGIRGGTFNFANGISTPGSYEVRLFFNGSYTVQASASFAIQVPVVASPTVTVSKAAYSPNESVMVNFASASGNAHDWIGLFAVGAANTNFIKWIYTDGTTAGSAGITSGAINFAGGLVNPGTYEVRLFFNNGYAVQARTSFAVQALVPGLAGSPTPASGTGAVGLSPTLSWAPGANTSSHQVYFGTSASLSAAQLKGKQSGASYSPGTLSAQTTYYWRVDEVNSQGTTPGTVWSFTTAGTPMVTLGKAGYNPNETVTVNFTGASGKTTDWIGLFTAGADNTNILQWVYTDGGKAGTAGISSGTVNFGGLSSPGNYEVRLFFNNSYTVQATAAFTVQASQIPATPSLTLSQSAYSTKDGITVNFKNASGSAHDWIGLFAAGASSSNHMQWTYTDGTKTGASGLTSGSVSFASGLLPAGNYEARLFFNDNYNVQASVPFTVTSAALQSIARNTEQESIKAEAEVVLSVTRSGNDVTLSCAGASGQVYAVEVSSDLVNWEPYATVKVSNGKVDVATESIESFTHHFYRTAPATKSASIGSKE